MIQFTQILTDDLIYTLGWTFVHSLWQGSLIALIMMIVLSRIPEKRAALRYAVSAGSMLSVLAVAAVTFAILYPGSSAQVGAITTVSAGPAEMVQSSSPVTAWINTHLPALVTIWLIGVFVLIVRFAFGLSFLHRLRHSAIFLDNAIHQTAERIMRIYGHSGSVRVAESRLISIPVVVGWIKPLVLFPVGAVNQLTPREVEAVLAHELAHIARGDFLQNLLQSIIEIIFYYHPAVWWISAVVRAERENCCDDLAVKACGDSLVYARALVSLQDMHNRAPALALSLSTSKNNLLKRVRRILNLPQNKSQVMEKMTATLLLILCLIFASFTGGAETDPAAGDDEAEYEMSYEYILSDTLPVQEIVIHKKDNDRDVKVRYRNGEVTRFELDGQVIPESEYDQHAELLSELRQEAQNVPEPSSPAAPPPPPAAPAPDNEVAPTAPPAPPAPPPPPPAPGKKMKRETLIIRDVDQDGNVVYRIEREGHESGGIVVDKDASQVIIGDHAVKIDADSVIIIEEVEVSPGRIAIRSAPRVQGYDFDYNFDSLQFKGVWGFNTDGITWYSDDDSLKTLKFEDLGFSDNLFLNDGNGRAWIQGMPDGNKLYNFNDGEKYLFRYKHHDEEDAAYFFPEDVESIAGLGKSYALAFSGTPHLQNRMLREMAEDGLIDAGGDYSVLLTGKKLKINGKRMPEETLEKYKKMFRQMHGYEIEGKTKIEISND